jgi:hypothetical protein
MGRLTKDERLILQEAVRINRRMNERVITPRPEFKELAIRDLTKVIRKMRRAIKEDDMDYLLQDYVDLSYVLDQLTSVEDVNSLSYLISSLDTAVRDLIPDSVYDYVGL